MLKKKNQQECFIGFNTTRRSRVVLDPIKHVLRVVLNSFKNTNEEYFTWYKANARDVLSVFDRLLGLWIINQFLKEL